jgi:hypothetical protein
MSYIESHPDKEWDWEGISQNLNLTMLDVESHPDIESHPDKEWDWGEISQNPGISMSDIESHPTVGNTDQATPWNWKGISYNEFNKDTTVLKKINKRI